MTAKVGIWRSACAVSDERPEPTILAVPGRQSVVLIDCAGQALVHCRRAGPDTENISEMMLTHSYLTLAEGVETLEF